MENAVSPTVVAAFAGLTSADPTRPVLTFYDDANGDRTELSGATLRNWIAKTANLLVDGHGLGHGDVAAVHLPAHWQTAAVLLGCWSAGLAVDLVADLATSSRPPDPRAAIAFATADRVGEAVAADVYALGLAPMALPMRPAPPAGTADFVVEVRGFGDHFSAAPAPAAAALADGTTHAELAARGAGRGLPAGTRVLIDGDAVTDPTAWLVGPLLAGSPVVLCRNLDPTKIDARLASERAVRYP